MSRDIRCGDTKSVAPMSKMTDLRSGNVRWDDDEDDKALICEEDCVDKQDLSTTLVSESLALRRDTLEADLERPYSDLFAVLARPGSHG